MLKYIIFEDEPAALSRITRLMQELRPQYILIGTADNVEDARNLALTNSYDLILSDVQLSDGLCFEVFENVSISKPIIFITAYDEYAVTAFKYNGLHYLLKPINLELLLEAIQKFEKNQIKLADFNSFQYPQKEEKPELQKRLISKVGSKLKVIEIKQIALFYTDNSLTNVLTFEGKNLIVDQNLDTLMVSLSSETFFRINRQMIVHIDAVSDMIAYSSNRYKLILSVPTNQEIVVSKEKCSLFKNWIASH
jgi:two-component system, LytTR family, response regulator LytT